MSEEFNQAVPRGLLRRDWLLLPPLLIISFLLVATGYLQYHWPQIWKGGAAPLSWEGAAFEMTQGQGAPKDERVLSIESLSARDIAVAAIVTKTFRARDYAIITWNVAKPPPGVELAFLWRTAEQPSRFHSRPLTVTADGVAPLELWNEGEWRGQVIGLALAVNGRLERPLALRGVTLKPVTMSAVIARTGGQWLATPRWDARSINFANAAALENDVSLLLAVSITLLVAIALYFILVFVQFIRPRPIHLWALVFAGWVVLDARWQWVLFHQLGATAQQFAGKSWEEKHLAADDRVLFEFARKAGAAIPAGGRVLFLSDDPYSRGKGAYYLYPHNVMAGADFALARYLKRGEHVILFAKAGVTYDAAARAAVSEQTGPIAAELVWAANGNLLLRVR